MSDKLKLQLITGAVLVFLGVLLTTALVSPLAGGAHMAMLALSPTYRGQFEAEQRALAPLRIAAIVTDYAVVKVAQLGTLATLGAAARLVIGAGYEYARLRVRVLYPRGVGLPAVPDAAGHYYVPTAGRVVPAQGVQPAPALPPLDAGADAIVLGSDNEGHAIARPLASLVHMLVAGTTGSGKSTYVRYLLSQLAGRGDTAIVILDAVGTSLSPLRDAVAGYSDTLVDCEASLRALSAEVQRRKTLFADARVDTLRDYNTATGESLPAILVVVEEVSYLLSASKASAGLLEQLIWTGRAKGVYLLALAQVITADSLPTLLRSNFGARIALSLEARHLDILFDGHAPTATRLARGEALVRTPGDTVRRVRFENTGMAAITGAGAGAPLSLPPVAGDTGDADSETAARIVELAAQGLSGNAIQREVFGYTGGAAYSALKAALSGTDGSDTTTG